MSARFQMFVVTDLLDHRAREDVIARVRAHLAVQGGVVDGAQLAAEGWVRIGRGGGTGGVFGGGQGDWCAHTRCPHCEAPLAIETDARARAAWGDAISAWYAGATGALACDRCPRATPIPDWPCDRPLAFGCVAFEFWEGPPLTDAFVDALRAVIGHPIRVVSGKL